MQLTPPNNNHAKLLISAILGIFALFTACASFAQKLDAAPNLEVGDKWTYKFTDIGNRRDPYTWAQQVTEIKGDDAYLHQVNENPNLTQKNSVWLYEMKSATIRMQFRWSETNQGNRGNKSTDRMKNDPDFQFPLEVGKTWKRKTYYDNGQGHTDHDVKVEAFEKIKTEAGEYDAFRIKYAGRWNQTVPNQQNWTGSGLTSLIQWYAPSVKRIIKWEYQNRNANGQLWDQSIGELIKWEPKAALPIAKSSAAPSPSPAASAPAAPASSAQ